MSYQKQNFANGEVLSAAQLNHIEDGIVDVESAANETKTVVDKIIDPTLSLSGKAADAKATGDAVGELKEDFDNLEGSQGIILNKKDFKNGNYNTDLGEITDGVKYAIRSCPHYKVTSSRLIVSIKEGYNLYIVGFDENGSFYPVLNTREAANFQNGDISVPITSKTVSFSLAKNDFSDITVDDIDIAKLKVIGIENIEVLDNASVARKGAKLFPNGDWVTVYEKNGEGILQNMFFAGDYPEWRTLIRITIDGMLLAYGSLYEFLGIWAYLPNNIKFGNSLFGKTGDVGGIYLNYKFPFYKSIKIELANDSANNMYVWFSCRVTDWYPISIGGVIIPYGAYFKMVSRLYENVQSGEEITLLEGLDACGLIIATLMSAKGHTTSWFQEGMLREYKNGSDTAELLSSSLEDYFCGTYYFRSGIFTNEVAGCTSINGVGGENSFSGYRLHTNDVLPFGRHGYKLTLRNNDLNTEEGSALQNETVADYRVIVAHYYW